MRRPTERQGWFGATLLAILAVVLFAFGLRRGSIPALLGAAVLGCTVLGGGVGYLAVADRDESELRADLDWRFAGPMVACFLLAMVATVASGLGIDTGVGIEPVTIAGVAFAGAFLAMALSSWVVEGRPRVAVGEVLAGLGWLALLVPVERPGLGPVFGVGVVLLMTGGTLALCFGPPGAAIRRRLESLG